MRKLVQFFNYLIYLTKSKTAHGIHSPFVYEFVSEILNDHYIYPEYCQVRQVRKDLIRSRKIVEVTDFGAGSGNKLFNTEFRKVSDIARSASVPEKTGQLLFRMIRHYKPANVLELGTSLGISTMYLALADTDSRIITLEGCASIAEFAQENFNRFGLGNIEQHLGSFECALNPVLKLLPSVDFAFIDGNHRFEPTIHYFEAILSKMHNDSIMVIDDIYWSKEMMRAWKQVKQHPRVRVSIDLYRIGIIFFREELSRKHYVLRH